MYRLTNANPLKDNHVTVLETFLHFCLFLVFQLFLRRSEGITADSGQICLGQAALKSFLWDHHHHRHHCCDGTVVLPK